MLKAKLIAIQVVLLVAVSVSSLAACQSEATETSQKQATNWRARRILLNREFGAEIQELANWCREEGIEDQVKPTFGAYRNFQLDRQYIFLPTTKRMPVAPVNVKGKRAQWLEKLNLAKRNHAVRLFKLAKEAADANAYAVAFQLLHEVIFYDRDHAEVRRILGHKLKDDAWKIHSEKVKPPRKAPRPHDIVKWPAGSFITVNTPHFQIDSNASEKETELLAKKLESWHYAWRQVFFEYWAKAPIIKTWLAGKGGLKIPRRRFRVVFFHNHAEYVKQVTPFQPGIERSAGYYSGDYKVSFFPATDANGIQDGATWRHELNHQLFRESIPSRKNPFAEHFLWLDEGVSMYFESLRGDGQILTLGGFDSLRLQYARWRRLRENYHVPIRELAMMDMPTFQRRQDISLLYAESAGIVHMLMDSRKYNTMPVLIRFMEQIHRGKVRPGLFGTMIGRTFEQLDEDHLEFLKVDSRDVEKSIEYVGSVSHLAAMDADLRESAFSLLGECINLRELDLTGAQLSKKRVIKMHQLDLLKKLYLNKCQIEPGAIQSLAQLASLQYLDLSSSSLDDSFINELLQLPRLQILQIANTRVSDQGLVAIANHPTLKVLDVTGSLVTAAGVAKFQKLRKDVELIQRK